MPTLIIRHDLDPTGKNSNNFVAGEKHDLNSRPVRVIAPNYGAFFTDDIKVVSDLTGKELVKGEQYFPGEYYHMPSGMYGKEICGIIVITDKTVAGSVTIQYQALGGPYGSANNVIIDQINRLMLDNRPIAWPSIVNKPDEFKSAHHLHDAGDVYGFEYLVYALDRLSSAVALGDAASHDVIYKYIDRIEALLKDQIKVIDTSINNHKNDVNNPHNTTAAQVGALSRTEAMEITNAITASLVAHTSNVNNPHQVTPAQLNVPTVPDVNSWLTTLRNELNAAINSHKNNTNNPHSTTAAQVGAYTIGQVDSLFNGVNAGLNSHVNNKANPHTVTAAQIGLGNVSNFPTGGYGDIAGGIGNKFITPDAVKAYIDARLAAYALPNSAWVQGSIHTPGSGFIYGWADGNWRRLWPADMGSDIAGFNYQFDRRLEERFDFYL